MNLEGWKLDIMSSFFFLQENEVWEGPPLVLAVLQLKTNRYAVQINVAEKRKREEVWRRVPISRCETQL